MLPQDELGSGASAWLPEASLWLGVAALIAAAVSAVGVWTLVVRLRDLRAEGERLGALEEIRGLVGRLVAERDDLDLRRLEHVLIDIRDAQKRLEDVLLRVVEGERAAPGVPGTALARIDHESLGERVANRLHSLGYERVQIVTRAEKLTELAANDGEVLVEARRAGVLHKGRVVVRSGRLADVEIHPAYSIFP